MSAIKLEQLQVGSTVYMVGVGGTVVECKVIALKARATAKTLVALETASSLTIEEFWDERFFPTAREAWYAVAMFAQRKMQENMAAAANAFKKAGIASDEPAAA